MAKKPTKKYEGRELPPISKAAETLENCQNIRSEASRIFLSTAPDRLNNFAGQLWETIRNAKHGKSTLPPGQLDKMVENALSSLPALLEAVSPNDEYEKTLKAVIELQAVFHRLQSNPVIQASPLVAEFVADLIKELGKSRDPHEILASFVVKASARNAVSARHKPGNELKRRVYAEYDRLLKANPKLTGNAAATKIAPLAVRWNTELGASLTSMLNVTRAEKTIRRWLTPSGRGGGCATP